MADTVNDLLSSFDRLSDSDQTLVLRELWSRINHRGDAALIEELTQSADALFQVLDREEEANGKAETW